MTAYLAEKDVELKFVQNNNVPHVSNHLNHRALTIKLAHFQNATDIFMISKLGKTCYLLVSNQEKENLVQSDSKNVGLWRKAKN